MYVGYWSIVQLLTIPDWLLDCVTDQNFILVDQIGPDTRSGKKYELMVTQITKDI